MQFLTPLESAELKLECGVPRNHNYEHAYTTESAEL